MAERKPVEVHGVCVHVELAIHTQGHRVAERIRIIDRLLRVQIATQRNRNSLTYQLRGFALAFRSNQVQRAKLVVLTPASPVGDLLEQFVELRLGVGLALRVTLQLLCPCGRSATSQSHYG